MSSRSVAVLVPVKAFDQAKVRLAGALDASARASLAKSMAAAVVRAAAPLAVSIVCDDDAVASWAGSLGASVIWCPGRGLNGAVADGVAHLGSIGIKRVIVAHADLPHALDLTWVADFDGITLVPDRHDDGTNVISCETDCGFTFAYGAGSFARHSAEGERLGLPLRVVREPRLGWDIDLPADLATPSWLDHSDGTGDVRRPGQT
ncbi:MAG: 2-phospho-L-lactate guanylyltransferase [Actinomycetes bacterium]